MALPNTCRENKSIMTPSSEPASGEHQAAGPGSARQLASVALVAFLATFMTARMMAFLIMSRSIPDLYLYLGGTHVHHLNIGIFLLSGVGGWLLFRPPSRMGIPAALYGAGLALTFDEFGMWLHLGGSYWQRASLDAVVVVGALLGWVAFWPKLRQFRPRHWWGSALLLLMTAVFFVWLTRSLRYAREVVLPRLQQLESTGPR